MPYFHLRFDHRSEEDLAKHLDFLLRLPGADSFTVLESKSNGTPHTHSIFTDDRTHSRVRQLWKAKFPDYDGKEDKCYQLKQIPDAELSKAECYLCKGESLEILPNVLQRRGKYKLFPTYTDDRHYEYWKDGGPKSHTPTVHPEGKTIVYHHMHEMVKPLKKKKPSFFDDVTAYLDERFPDRVWKMNEWQIMHRALYKFHGRNFRPWGPQQIMGELRVLLAHYCYDEFYEHAEDEVVNLGYLQRNNHYLHTD